MPKYRLLTYEELATLESDFIDFLVLNGITSDEWIKIKEEGNDTAKNIIDLFSDVVFEKILRGIQYLICYESHSVKAFKCDKETVYLLGMDSEDKHYNLATKEGIEKAKINPPKDLKGYRTSKPYYPNREAELFRMIENGCEISEGTLYYSLDTII